MCGEPVSFYRLMRLSQGSVIFDRILIGSRTLAVESLRSCVTNQRISYQEDASLTECLATPSALVLSPLPPVYEWEHEFDLIAATDRGIGSGRPCPLREDTWFGRCTPLTRVRTYPKKIGRDQSTMRDGVTGSQAAEFPPLRLLHYRG